jgi:hypothetical protein
MAPGTDYGRSSLHLLTAPVGCTSLLSFPEIATRPGFTGCSSCR